MNVWTAGSLPCPGVEFEAQGLHHPHHRSELWVSIGRKGLVEALPPKARSLCDLGHPLRPSDIPQRRCYQRGVPLFEGRLQVGHHVFLSVEVLCCIPGVGRCFGHIDHLNPFADGSHIPGISQRQPPDSSQDPGFRLPIPEALEPPGIAVSLADFKDNHKVSYGIRHGKRKARKVLGSQHKEKAPGPWPRGTRETAVFGGDCISRLPFGWTECKPNIPFLMMADVASVKGKVLPDSGRSDGPMGLSGPAQLNVKVDALLTDLHEAKGIDSAYRFDIHPNGDIVR